MCWSGVRKCLGGQEGDGGQRAEGALLEARQASGLCPHFQPQWSLSFRLVLGPCLRESLCAHTHLAQRQGLVGVDSVFRGPPPRYVLSTEGAGRAPEEPQLPEALLVAAQRIWGQAVVRPCCLIHHVTSPGTFQAPFQM